MLHRRDAMLRLGQLGLGSLALPGLLRAQHALASADQVPRTSGKAKSCILVYLWGGPPQQDMWDMKPEAPEGIRGIFRPIDTVVPGMQISDQLPLVAKHADKLAIVRSLTHPSNVHEASVYHTLTGHANPTLALPRNKRNRRDHPGAGAIVSNFSPPGGMPASVTIPRPIGHDGVVYSGTHAGFLGPRHDPLELMPPAEVNEPAPHTFELTDGLNAARVQARFGLLELMEQHDRRMQGGAAAQETDDFRQQAFRMLTSPESKRAFDLEQEPAALHDLYGRNEYGESFLLARRLVESGVRLITFTWYYVCTNGDVANVWDNHGGTGSLGGISGYDMLKANYCLPSLNQGFAALLEDLSQRGLLDETMIAMYGEFGRTPTINSNAGRDHWGA
ncbi:MAG: DUF1501 domain-containing protein, partial [Pirellulales bacterium]